MQVFLCLLVFLFKVAHAIIDNMYSIIWLARRLVIVSILVVSSCGMVTGDSVMRDR